MRSGPVRRRVVVVPNCLRGFATAAEVAGALAAGVRRAAPDIPVTLLPLADGGDGTLAALAATGTGRWMSTNAVDAVDRGRRVPWLAISRRTAAIESAAVCGLGSLQHDELHPLHASSAGVGQVLARAVSSGATTIMLGLGGTAVVDGGAGALAALGARFLDADGRVVQPKPICLAHVARVDLEPARRLLAGTVIRLLSDVRTPLAGNLTCFGAQKGITERTQPIAAAALHRLVELLAAAGEPEVRRHFHTSWFGAGGGIGVGLSSVARTTAAPGSGTLLELRDTDDAVGSSALAITAEGKVDASTWNGKLPGVVADRRRESGLPTAMVAVRFTTPVPDRSVSRHLIVEPPPARPVAGAALRDGLAHAAEAACLTWSVSGSAARP